MHFYDDWAQRILHGQFTDHLAFYGLPLYPYFLAFVYKLTGYGPFLPVLLQALLEAGTAVIIYKLGVRVFFPHQSGRRRNEWPELCEIPSNRDVGQAVGIVAALGWAFFVPAQVYAVILMPTVWFVFSFWLLIWLIMRTDSAPRWAACLGYGLLIGFVAMGVATILFLVPLVLAAIFLKPHKSEFGHPLVAKLSAALLLFLGIGIGTAPCWVHNAFVARDPVFFRPTAG